MRRKIKIPNVYKLYNFTAHLLMNPTWDICDVLLVKNYGGSHVWCIV